MSPYPNHVQQGNYDIASVNDLVDLSMMIKDGVCELVNIKVSESKEIKKKS